MFTELHSRHPRSRRRACIRLGLAVWMLVLASAPGLANAEDAPSASGEEALSRDVSGADGAGESDSIAPDEPEIAEESPDYTGPPPGVETIVIKSKPESATGPEATVFTTVFEARELEALGATDIADLAAVTPSLEIKTASGTTPTFFVRGVGLLDFGANATGAVAIYKDGAPINAPALQMGLLFDTQVNVLTGPQGYGNWRNASAGAISFDPNLPTGAFDARARFDSGRFGLVDAEGVLSNPISDAISSRTAFRFLKRNSYVDNQCGNLPAPTRGACGANEGNNFRPLFVPQGLPRKVNDEREWAMRTLLRFQPVDTETDWVLNVHGGRVGHEAPLGQVIGVRQSAQGPLTRSGYIDPKIAEIHGANAALFPGDNSTATSATLEAVTDDIDRADPLDNAYNLVGDERLSTYGATLSGKEMFGDVELRLVTGGERWDRERLDDLDFSPDTVIQRDADDDGWQLTQSAEVSSELERLPLLWRAGGFYLHDDLDSETLFTYSINPLFAQQVDQDYTQELHSFGVYAGFDFDLSEDFRLEGGLRYNWERKDFELRVERFIVGATNSTLPASDQRTWDAPTGSLSLTYLTPFEGVSTYAKYTRGWKPGHFNSAILENASSSGSAQLSPDITFADPETNNAFELGFESHLFDDLVKLRAALFYYLYENYQVFVLQTTAGAPPQFEIINAKDSKVWGAELELYTEPLRPLLPDAWGRFMLEARAGWLESEFEEFVRRRDTIVGGALITDFIDYSGNRLPNTPRFKLSASASYEVPLGRFGTVIPRYDFSFTDDIFFDPSEGRGTPPAGTRIPLPDNAIGQRGYWLHNLRLTYRLPGEHIEISGWVRNLTDERYKSFVADGSIAIESLLNYIGDPRTYGGSISFWF